MPCALVRFGRCFGRVPNRNDAGQLTTPAVVRLVGSVSLRALVLATRQKVPDDGTEPFATLALPARSHAASGRGAATRDRLYCALCWPNPQEIKALLPQQPNRRAVGAASCQRHASGMTMRGGLRP